MIFSKQPVQNRYGKNILVHFEPAKEESYKLVIIQHGYSGSMDEIHIKVMMNTYLDNGYSVLMLDCTNSFNDADGTLEENTIQSHAEDLEDAIDWAADQEWYREPFALAGHSLGGLSIMAYASKNSDKITSLFPAAMVVNGRLLEQCLIENDPKYHKELTTNGKIPMDCSYKENVTGFRTYKWYTTMYGWDATQYAQHITAPTLLVVGDEDLGTPPKDQQKVFDVLNAPKKMEIIKGADHCYVGKEKELEAALDTWLKEINHA